MENPRHTQHDQSGLEAVNEQDAYKEVHIPPIYDPYQGQWSYISPGTDGAYVAPAPAGKMIAMKRTTFFAVAGIAALVVIGAIIGGVVGGLKARSSNNGNDKGNGNGNGNNNNASTDGPNSTNVTQNWHGSVYTESKLASANLTNGYAVFYQDQYLAIIASVYNATQNRWSIKNVTSSISQTGNSIDPKPGTPLAAISNLNSSELRVYWITKGNTLTEATTTNMDNWSLGPLASFTKNTHKDSMLSAVWQQCPMDYCADEPVIIYQDPYQRFAMANGSDYSKAVLAAGGFERGSGVAVTQFGTELEKLRAYGDQSGTLQELWWGDGPSGTSGLSYGTQVDSNINSTMSQLAVTGFGEKGWIQLILTELNNNGTLTCNWWNNVRWETEVMPQINNVTNAANYTFSAIAVNNNLRFYGLVEGTIHQFKIDPTIPTSWTWEMDVTTP